MRRPGAGLLMAAILGAGSGMAVEEEFEIEIDDEEAERYATVGDIMDLVVLNGGK